LLLLIAMMTTVLYRTDTEDDDAAGHGVGLQTGVSFSDNHIDRSDDDDGGGGGVGRRRRRKPSLMSFPSLEHLDRNADGSPWRRADRKRRRFRGGIGGLRRAARQHDDADDVDDDDTELDRVTTLSVYVAFSVYIIDTFSHTGGSVAEWLACWTQAQYGPGSNRSRDAVG